MICAAGLTFGTAVEASASQAQTTTTTQAAPRKGGKKGGAKKAATPKKYVPVSFGDCYIGTREHLSSGASVWCEITFNPNGTCCLKTENSSLDGTFTGTVTGSKYKITVKFNDGQEYEFVGNKENLVADDGIFKYEMGLEH